MFLRCWPSWLSGCSISHQHMPSDWVSELVKSLSRVRLFATPWTAYCGRTACQTPSPMEFSRQEYWSGLLFPSPGDLPNPGIEPRSPALLADVLPSEPLGKSHSIWLHPKKGGKRDFPLCLYIRRREKKYFLEAEFPFYLFAYNWIKWSFLNQFYEKGVRWVNLM